MVLEEQNKDEHVVYSTYKAEVIHCKYTLSVHKWMQFLFFDKSYHLNFD